MEAHIIKGRRRTKLDLGPKPRIIGKCKFLQRMTSQGERGYLDMVCVIKVKNMTTTKKLGLWDSESSSHSGVIIA